MWGVAKRHSLMEGLLEKSGFSTHVSDPSHRQAWIFSSLKTVGPTLTLGESEGLPEGSTEASTEGWCDGCAEEEGGFDACTDGPDDFVGALDSF
jgi:hypothetical protein